MRKILQDPPLALAYFWSLIAASLLIYIVVKHGDKMEILTLILGLIGGTIIGGIFGKYFSSSHKQSPITTTQASGTLQVDTTTTDTNESVN